MMLENESKLGKEEYLALNNVLLLRTVLPVTLVLEIILLFFVAVMYQTAADSGLYIAFSSLAVIFPLLIILAQASVIRRLYKSDQITQAGAANHYTFYDTYMIIDTKAVSAASHSEITYAKLYKAVETKAYLFLFLNAQNAFICAKSGFLNGKPEDLKTYLLQNKVKCRFKK